MDDSDPLGKHWLWPHAKRVTAEQGADTMFAPIRVRIGDQAARIEHLERVLRDTRDWFQGRMDGTAKGGTTRSRIEAIDEVLAHGETDG